MMGETKDPSTANARKRFFRTLLQFGPADPNRIRKFVTLKRRDINVVAPPDHANGRRMKFIRAAVLTAFLLTVMAIVEAVGYLISR